MASLPCLLRVQWKANTDAMLSLCERLKGVGKKRPHCAMAMIKGSAHQNQSVCYTNPRRLSLCQERIRAMNANRKAPLSAKRSAPDI